MTHMTQLPGYQGYLRYYQREHVDVPSAPSRKYSDVSQASQSVLASSPYTTIYRDDTNAKRLLNVKRNEIKHTVAPPAPLTKTSEWNWQQGVTAKIDDVRALKGRSSKRAAQGLYTTSYDTTIGSGITHVNKPIITTSPDKLPPPLPDCNGSCNSTTSLACSISDVSNMLLRSIPNVQTGYHRDLGKRGEQPGHRYPASAVPIQSHDLVSGSFPLSYPNDTPSHTHLFPSKHVIGPSQTTSIGDKEDMLEGNSEAWQHSRYAPLFQPTSPITPSSQSTTFELFKGSTKVSKEYVPGYCGFIPEMRNEPIKRDNWHKEHILTTFRHDMPGYSGSAPTSVQNVRGPRTPRGKKRMNESMVASLILESMKI